MRELEFVDDARREMVDILERSDLRVASTSVPKWISIEATVDGEFAARA